MTQTPLTGPLVEARDQLVEATTRLADDDDVGPAALAAIVAGVRAVEQATAGLKIEVARVARRLEKSGAGDPVEVVLAADDTVTAGAVSAEVARVEVTDRFPVLGSAMRHGVVPVEHVDIVARTTAKMTPDEIDVLAGHDTTITEAAVRGLRVESFRRRLHRLRDKVRGDAGQKAADLAHAETEARTWVRRDRMTHGVHAVLDGLQGAAVSQALRNEKRALADTLGPEHGLTPDQLGAQALTDLIVRGAGRDPDRFSSIPRVHVDVVTDGQTLTDGPHDTTVAETAEGVRLSPDTVGRLTCDCVLRRLDTLPDGNVHATSSARAATPAQRSALRAMYGGCAITGAPWSRVEIHHVTPVGCHGQTRLDNLVPITSRWHHLIHDAGWRLEMDGDRTLRLYKPDGTLHRTIPPPPPGGIRTHPDHTHDLAA